MLDALGNPIIIGATYGYAMSSNGHGNVTVGVATKMNKKVSIKVASVKRYLYGEPIEPWFYPPENVSVYSYNLFPVENLTR
jgi:hypothetical protein